MYSCVYQPSLLRVMEILGRSSPVCASSSSLATLAMPCIHSYLHMQGPSQEQKSQGSLCVHEDLCVQQRDLSG